MKKLSNVEINVLSNEINKRINEKKYENIKSKLIEDVDFKKLEKVNKEINELSKKINELSKKTSEKIKFTSELKLKLKNKFNINCLGLDNNNEIIVTMFNNLNVYNDLVLYSIDKELNVDELIDKVVDKYLNK